jgi:hypothetical protein
LAGRGFRENDRNYHKVEQEPENNTDQVFLSAEDFLV